MTKKIITAADILNMKGYKAAKFDTAAFNDAVTAFFLANEVNAKLYIRPVRFADMDDAPPPCGFIDRSGDVERRRRERDNEIYLYGHIRTLSLLADTLRPEIMVDEPFCKNAVHMLQLIQGYVVQKSGGSYIVTLM